MATLQDLKINRRLYRRTSATEETNPISSYSNSSSGSTTGGSSSSSTSTPPATAVAPGTVIQSAIWQTSASDNRIELNPDDTLLAYLNGVPLVEISGAAFHAYTSGGDEIVTIDTNGIITKNSSGDNVVEIDDAGFRLINSSGDTVWEFFNGGTGQIEMTGVYQPVVYMARIDAAGNVLANSTPGITCVRVSTGNYGFDMGQILTGANWVVACTAISGHYRARVTSQILTGFGVTWQQSDYATQVIGVSGGGGGSVTVPNVYQGEVPVDTEFNIIVTRLL